MRKVVTGSQVAQLRNTDPFAVPVWRSPVYRTRSCSWPWSRPARLLGRLIRFLARHPAPVLAVVTGILLWRVLGWADLAALALTGTVVLAVWRRRFPSSFARLVAASACGRWRCWHYRRRWGAVMTIARLAPVYQGQTLVPVLGKVSATRIADWVHVRLVSGQSAQDFAARTPNLAYGFGAALCQVRTAAPGSPAQLGSGGVEARLMRKAMAAAYPAASSLAGPPGEPPWSRVGATVRGAGQPGRNTEAGSGDSPGIGVSRRFPPRRPARRVPPSRRLAARRPTWSRSRSAAPGRS